MKGSETFKKIIKAYLDKRAAEDELFAKDYAKPGKNIDDCCDFIISEVKKSGRQGSAEKERLKKKAEAQRKKDAEIGQLSLFDF